MPYPPGHRAATKAAIVRVARRLFNRFGFDGVSVDQIMAEAGLTHGGFYRHFESKSDLYAEAMQCFFTDPGWDSAWEGVEIDRAVARAGEKARRAYETVFKAMVALLQSGSRAEQHPDRTIALSIAALCVGGMVIARASDGRAFADEVRNACLAVALRLAGWDDSARFAPNPPSGREDSGNAHSPEFTKPR